MPPAPPPGFTGPWGWWRSEPPCTGRPSYREALLENWERARRGEPLRPIPPLE
ncbi:hypothetical protein [Thermus tengchongensis]|uniref:hypothetical protein n=1 Tax=Thermus tengchongensis TaxID=1214928 RepID=UPI001F35B6FE|nr:hypothetical protein [Thermus tengchongensis]